MVFVDEATKAVAAHDRPSGFCEELMMPTAERVRGHE
jgi:hypothetical protein